jgi:hypothetical protein
MDTSGSIAEASPCGGKPNWYQMEAMRIAGSANSFPSFGQADSRAISKANVKPP